MCDLCDHGHALGRELYGSGIPPRHAIHILVTALTDVLLSSTVKAGDIQTRVDEVWKKLSEGVAGGCNTAKVSQHSDGHSLQ